MASTNCGDNIPANTDPQFTETQSHKLGPAICGNLVFLLQNALEYLIWSLDIKLSKNIYITFNSHRRVEETLSVAHGLQSILASSPGSLGGGGKSAW